MNSMIVKSAAGFRGLCATLILFIALTTISYAQVLGNQPWTTTGSTGTADEGSEFSFTGGTAFLTGSAGFIRYNVVAVDGLFENAPFGQAAFPQMTVRFRDSEDTEKRVRVFLRRTPLAGGNTVTLLSMDTNNFAPSINFQTQSVRAGCGDNFSFDFVHFAYYIEVEMTNEGPVSPAVAQIQLGLIGDVCIQGPGN
ncbi:MAG TPA: hypothetical protein VJS64_05980 [Pyrinomonadaceae bacterium]|nr:hypothetical protein [Pyrinomonadaceae bacterium]